MDDYLTRLRSTAAASRSRSQSSNQTLSKIVQSHRDSMQPTKAPNTPAQTRPGGVVRGPAGSSPQVKGELGAWINQALGVLKLDSSYASGIANMIQRESSGNPNAINNWDSNAKKGTPSKGLMQTIDTTFAAHKLPGYDNIYDPVANIIAGVRYARSRYGDDMVKAGGRKNSAGKYIGY